MLLSFSVVFAGSLVSAIGVSFLETSSCEGISLSEEVANSSEVSVCSDFSAVFGGVKSIWKKCRHKDCNIYRRL